MSDQTKESIKHAATRLFYTHGYHGTSVRDIAKEASVNSALISYYFGGKQPLFETLMIEFFEGYIQSIEEAMYQANVDVDAVLPKLFKHVFTYQQSRHLLARMAHREMTMDSTLVREVMSTYLRKEQFLLEQIIHVYLDRKQLKRIPVDLTVLHLRNMLTLPFSSPQYLRELFLLAPDDHLFMKRYVSHAEQWMKSLLQTKDTKRLHLVRG
ncbi:forespore capture DNA-binding protein RefZ [Shouchella sp. JSM 1781072]|uniref:forespore capture DNA-binding protein RefZ n=1 Tax=Shouchella sp. JSM 1781072 TaxID=3344581 RepID=UPI0035C146C9